MSARNEERQVSELDRSPCPVCRDDRERVPLSPQQWVRRVHELRDAVASGAYVLEHADVPFDAITTQRPTPEGGGDVIVFRARCTGCGWGVTLAADQYHGAASWTPDDPRLVDAPDASWGEHREVPQRASVTERRGLRERWRDARAAGRYRSR
jgi:hypothetical protein